MSKFVLKKGLDIPVAGVPEQVITDEKNPYTVAVLGPDYNGLKPKMFVAVGDKVKKKEVLFFVIKIVLKYHMFLPVQGSLRRLIEGRKGYF